MAKPKKEKELSRSHLIAFRLTDIEYDFVTSMAQKAGLSASAYIRKLLLEGNVNIIYEVVADVPENVFHRFLLCGKRLQKWRVIIMAL